MHERMLYGTLPSLERAALIRTVITLWNQDDIRNSLVNGYYPFVWFNQSQWKDLEDRVTRKALKLPLPKSLKESILGLIEPIGLRILKWKNDHINAYIRIILPRELCWTAQGTVDEKKTAEVLIEDTNLDIVTRYKLACINCLEDDVPELWKKIPESHKHDLCREKGASGVREHKFVSFWTYSIRGEAANLDRLFESWRHTGGTLHQCAFEFAALNGYKLATGYFLQKLTFVEREVCLVRIAEDVAQRCYSFCIPSKNYADIFCFLLSQMSEEHQVEVFKKCPYNVLRCLLDWPWQDFFMEAAKRLWNFLSIFDFDRLLKILVREVERGSKDYNYQYLLGEFWQQSLTSHKSFLIDQLASARNEYCLLGLLRVKDRENIKLILKDASTLKRKNLFFSDGGIYICQKLIHEDENDLLKFFIQECMPSKNMLIKSKKKLRERIRGTVRVTRSMYRKSFVERRRERENLYLKLLQVVLDLIREYDKKRPAQKGNCNPRKKLCTRQHQSTSEVILKG